MHVVLAFSPVGDAFRTRRSLISHNRHEHQKLKVCPAAGLRMFPSLVNCCTIDWFAEWPAEVETVGMTAGVSAQNLSPARSSTAPAGLVQCWEAADDSRGLCGMFVRCVGPILGPASASEDLQLQNLEGRSLLQEPVVFGVTSLPSQASSRPSPWCTNPWSKLPRRQWKP